MRAMRFAALALGSVALAGAATAPAVSASEPIGAPAGLDGRMPVSVASSLSPVHAHASAHAAAAAHGPSLAGALQALARSGAISSSEYTLDYGAYTATQGSLAHLSGTRRTELAAVLANVQSMAAARTLVRSRLPAVVLTLERNRQLWSGEAIPAADAHVSFPGSRIVWERYPGQGVEIQWLATFGEANGYYLSGHENANLRQLLAEVLPLATERAGGIAWDYLFSFDGGTPPWTSGLSQGTAIQVLARAWQRFKEPAYLTAAQRALGIFEQPPPEGVRVTSHAGAMYAEYTYAPSDRILNGFIQALVGLYEYTKITKDPLGQQLFEAGDAEARAIVPLYDTGAWSLYDQFGESDLNYHELLTEFLQHLCERTQRGQPSDPTGSPIAGDSIYCTTAQSFTADLHSPPALALLSTKLTTSARAGVELSLSKISTVSLIVRQGAKLLWSNTATVERGHPKLLWVTPSTPGSYSVSLTATDLAGNRASASGTIVLSRRQPKRT